MATRVFTKCYTYVKVMGWWMHREIFQYASCPPYILSAAFI
jgi:hypothetical protein